MGSKSENYKSSEKKHFERLMIANSKNNSRQCDTNFCLIPDVEAPVQFLS